MRIYTEVIKNQVREAYKIGTKFSALSSKFDIPYSTLARIVKGVSQDDLGKVDVRRALSAEEELRVVDVYNTSLRSAEDIAKDFGVCGFTIRATLIRYGVTRRKRGTRLWTDDEKKRLSERVKRDWVEKRDIYLAGIRKVSWKPDGRVLEMRLTITARRKLTNDVIGRDIVCVRCGSLERLHIHHIKAIQDRPDLAMDPDNCETLCNRCHASEESSRRWKKQKMWDEYRDVLPLRTI